MIKGTYWQQTRGALIAMALTAIVLPILGLWAAASGIESVIRKIINMNTPKGT